MSLVSGTRLGPYEIVAPLGAGAMGEVYRARDTRLGRDVAVKTLPAAFAQDAERLARFESEARAVAALSHPNVLALHDLGTHGDTTYAVMELIEGQTLRERMLDGPLAAPRALGIAVQIARGLAAAHDKGVVHRDLKPENVMLTADGQAKILDFGLAKRTAPANGDESLAPTLAVSTEPGVVLGTVGYMSPEQVRGLPADARSDLFALGAVLHEMLSGRRAFHADTSADTMSAILREDPADLTQLVPELSPALASIVRRCLEKQPAARFRSAADLAYALEAIGSGSGASGARAAAAPVGRPRFKRLTYRNGMVSGARFIPDGSGVVFGATWEGRPFEIFSAHPGSPDARSLGLPPANLLSMSRGGEMAVSLGYHNHYWNQVRGTLARTALGGGGVRAMHKDVGHADWSPDGRAMAMVRYVEGSCRLEYPAGTVRLDTPDWLSRPSVSRDGRHVAFARHPFLGDSSGDIGVADTNGTVRTLIPGMTSISGVAWSPSGDEVWASGIHESLQNGIWGVTLDGSRREIYTSPARVMLHDVAPDGRALISLGNLHLGLSVSAGADTREIDLSWFDGSCATDVSADGRQILFWEGHEAENPYYACFLRDVDGSPAVRLGEGNSTRLSPDGQWALAITVRREQELWMYPTGVGEPRRIPVEGLERLIWAGFHPAGHELFLVGSERERAKRLYMLPIEGGVPRLMWDEPIEDRRLDGLAVSPDGDRVALRRPSGEQVLFSCRAGTVEPVAGLAADEVALRFDSTGGLLYVVGRGSIDRRVDRLDWANGERTPWRRLMPPDPTGVIYASHPAVSGDGSCIAYSYYRHIADLYLVEGLG